MSWAVGAWTRVESRALLLGVIARPGGPSSVLDLPPSHLLALLEGLVRENEAVAQTLDEIYAEATVDPEVRAREAREARRRQIDRAIRRFG